MKPEFENIPLAKNEDKKRFEIEIDGHFAFINFTETQNQISLNHTEVEKELEGKGAATAVIEKTLENIEKSGKKLLPFCPLVFAYIKRHPDWIRIVDKGFKGFN